MRYWTQLSWATHNLPRTFILKMCAQKHVVNLQHATPAAWGSMNDTRWSSSLGRRAGQQAEGSARRVFVLTAVGPRTVVCGEARTACMVRWTVRRSLFCFIRSETERHYCLSVVCLSRNSFHCPWSWLLTCNKDHPFLIVGLIMWRTTIPC